MSADNYFVVRRHPDGGFAYVMGFASDDDPDLTVTPSHRQYPTLDDATNAAIGEYSEYGVRVHAECRESMADAADAAGGAE